MSSRSVGFLTEKIYLLQNVRPVAGNYDAPNTQQTLHIPIKESTGPVKLLLFHHPLSKQGIDCNSIVLDGGSRGIAKQPVSKRSAQILAAHVDKVADISQGSRHNGVGNVWII